MSSENPYEEGGKVDKVKEILRDILRHALLLRGHLKQIDTEQQTNLEDAVHKIKNEIIVVNNRLSELSGYCNNNTRKKITEYSKEGSSFFLMEQPIGFKLIKSDIDQWASKIQSVELDYNSYPFSVKSGLEVNASPIRAYIEYVSQGYGFSKTILVVFIFGLIFGIFIGKYLLKF